MNPNAATLRFAVVPRSGLLTDAALVVLGTLLVAGAAQVSFHIPGTPVPITGQTFGVVLVGSALGSVRGAASLLLYFLSGLVLPFYAHGAKGWDEIVGATGGYILGFILAAIVTGYLAERRWDRRLSSSLGAMLTGNVLIYAVGLPWLATHAGGPTLSLDKTLQYGLYPFILGDLVKLYLAGASLPLAWKGISRFRGEG